MNTHARALQCQADTQHNTSPGQHKNIRGRPRGAVWAIHKESAVERGTSRNMQTGKFRPTAIIAAMHEGHA
eukprot:5376419-Alexandrium_andersonii.AAC.1